MAFNLHIRCIQALGLRAADMGGTSDPYVIFKIGEKKQKTQVVKKTVNPKWDETFVFEGLTDRERLRVTIKDWNRVGRPEFLGQFVVPFTMLSDGSPKEARILLKGNEKYPGVGDLHLILHLIRQGQVPQLIPSGKTLEPIHVQMEGKGQLMVKVMSGKDLAVKDACGTSDPYCILTMGSQEFRSKTIERNLNPVWDEEFYFEVPSQDATLQIEVMDWDMFSSDDPMGITTVKLRELQAGNVVEKWCTLVPKKNERVQGQIHIAILYTTAEQAQKAYQLAKTNYQEILQLLSADRFGVAATLCKVYESNDLAKSLVHVSNAEHSVYSLLTVLIYREIGKTVGEAQIFRLDSSATKTITVFLKHLDSVFHWVDSTLGDVVRGIIRSPDGYEVDPDKIPRGENASLNQQKLHQMAQQLFDAISSSMQRCPWEFRQVLSIVRKVVSNFFPQAALKSVGSILFLRFLCPAISAPEIYGIVPLMDPPQKKQRRALVLLTKVLQALANEVRFGGKEDFMAPLNAFVEANIGRIQALYDDISAPPPGQQAPQTAIYDQESKTTSMAIVVKHLRGNMAKLDAETDKEMGVTSPVWKFGQPRVPYNSLPEPKRKVARLVELLCEGI